MIHDLIIRFLGWLVNKVGVSTLFLLGLLLVIILTVTTGLEASVRGLQGHQLIPIAILGLLMGWWLARSRLSLKQATLLALVTGGFILVFYIDKLYLQIGRILAVFLQITRQGWFWETNWIPLSIEFTNFLSQASLLWMHISTWLTKLIQSEPTSDRLAIGLLWGLAIFMSAAWAGWSIRRERNPLISVLPSAALLAISLNYVRGNPLYLSVTIAGTLLLIILTKHIRLESDWNSRQIDYSDEIRFDIAMTSIFLSLALVAIAWMTPSINIRGSISTLNDFAHKQSVRFETIGQSIGLIPGSNEDVTLNVASKSGLPRSHLLGSGPELSEQMVMSVSIEELSARNYDKSNLARRPKYYWRSVTYDQYTGSGWAIDNISTSEYQAGELIIDSIPETSRLVTQRVERLDPEMNLVFVTGALVSIDQTYTLAWRETDNNDPNLDIFAASTEGQKYQAQSFYPTISEQQLRTTQSYYPKWVLDRYTDLPENIPKRVLDLATQVTEGHNTAYDKASAIESFLRQYPYSLEIPAPPPDQDVVDYFLFDLQQGYCDYYATAMVVMARSVGLPARLVTGYASGTYDANEAWYLITEANAHSWPEVYFPEFGWIEFEPTAAQSIFERPEENITDFNNEQDLHPLLLSSTSQLDRLILTIKQWGWITWLAIGVGLILLFVSILIMYDLWRLQRQPPDQIAFILYGRLRNIALRLGATTKPSDTPYEFVHNIEQHIKIIDTENRWGGILANALIEIRQIAQLFTRSAYSPHKPSKPEGRLAAYSWARLQFRLWLARLIQKANRFLP